jgi:hypothetical protein
MPRVSDTNIPSVPLRWSVAAAGREFDVAQQTLERKLRDAQVFPDAGGAYTTKGIARAIYGSLFAERLRRITEEADRVAMMNQVARGELLERRDLERAMAAVAEGIIGVIENSGLSRADQDEIRRNMSSFRVIVQEQARSQDKRRGLSTNGARPEAGATGEAKKRGRGRPKKRESKHPEADQSES